MINFTSATPVLALIHSLTHVQHRPVAQIFLALSYLVFLLIPQGPPMFLHYPMDTVQWDALLVITTM